MLEDLFILQGFHLLDSLIKAIEILIRCLKNSNNSRVITNITTAIIPKIYKDKK